MGYLIHLPCNILFFQKRKIINALISAVENVVLVIGITLIPEECVWFNRKHTYVRARIYLLHIKKSHTEENGHEIDQRATGV